MGDIEKDERAVRTRYGEYELKYLPDANGKLRCSQSPASASVKFGANDATERKEMFAGI